MLRAVDSGTFAMAVSPTTDNTARWMHRTARHSTERRSPPNVDEATVEFMREYHGNLSAGQAPAGRRPRPWR